MKQIPLLTADQIEVKVKKCTENGAIALLYKTARTDMEILDDVFGSQNWTDKYEEIKGNLYCSIGVREDITQPFVYKSDCGIESREDDDGNQKKGEASDAFKRAGFKHGIGRELYTAPKFIFLKVATKEDKGKFVIADKYQTFEVVAIDYKDKCITKLIIQDNKGNIVFDNSKQIEDYGTDKTSTPTSPKIVPTTPITTTPNTNTTNETYKFTGGKYTGKTVEEVLVKDKSYLEYLYSSDKAPKEQKEAIAKVLGK